MLFIKQLIEKLLSTNITIGKIVFIEINNNTQKEEG